MPVFGRNGMASGTVNLIIWLILFASSLTAIILSVFAYIRVREESASQGEALEKVALAVERLAEGGVRMDGMSVRAAALQPGQDSRVTVYVENLSEIKQKAPETLSVNVEKLPSLESMDVRVASLPEDMDVRVTSLPEKVDVQVASLPEEVGVRVAEMPRSMDVRVTDQPGRMDVRIDNIDDVRIRSDVNVFAAPGPAVPARKEIQEPAGAEVPERIVSPAAEKPIAQEEEFENPLAGSEEITGRREASQEDYGQKEEREGRGPKAPARNYILSALPAEEDDDGPVPKLSDITGEPEPDTVRVFSTGRSKRRIRGIEKIFSGEEESPEQEEPLDIAKAFAAEGVMAPGVFRGAQAEEERSARRRYGTHFYSRDDNIDKFGVEYSRDQLWDQIR